MFLEFMERSCSPLFFTAQEKEGRNTVLVALNENIERYAKKERNAKMSIIYATKYVTSSIITFITAYFKSSEYANGC